MSHPEVPNPCCMSCGRDLAIGQFMGIFYSVRHGVPNEVECCSRCWSRVPVHERIKLLIAIRDRQGDGILSIIASMGMSAIWEQRNGVK